MNQALKVGLFMAVCLAVLAWLVLKVEDLRLFGPEPTVVEAEFDSVTGLDDRSTVRVAGVRVGRVDGVRLDGRLARVRILLEMPLELTEGSFASISNAGILGDKYVELMPGPSNAPRLPEGAVLPGRSPLSWDDALAKVGAIGDSVLNLTESFDAEGGGASLGRLVDNLEALTVELRNVVSDNRAQLSSTVANFETFSATLASELPRIADQMQSVLARIDSALTDNRDDLSKGLANIRQLTETAQVTIENLNQITSRIAAGEGSIGKLVNSEEAHDSLVTSLDAISEGVDTLTDSLGRVRKLQLDLGFDGYYLEGLGENRTAFALDLDPQSSRFYHVALVDDPRGRVRSDSERVIVNAPDGTESVTTTRTVRTEDRFSITAQLGVELDQFRFRAGLLESTGGAGVDWLTAGNRLTLSLEAFDFNREEDLAPRLRLTGRFKIFPNVDLLGGYDDFLESDTGSLFLGAGIRWNDDDLKYLLGSVPRF